MGKPGYVAPEVVAMKPATPAEDVYAWALLVAEALTGRRIFRERDVAEAALRGDAKSLVAEIDAGGLLSACLARDADQRPDVTTAIARLQAAVPEAGTTGARDALAAIVATSEGTLPPSPVETGDDALGNDSAVQGATTRTVADPVPSSGAIDTLRASAIDSRPAASPTRWTAGFVGVLLGVAGVALLGGAFAGRAIERRIERNRDTTLTLPSLPARTEYHLDGHILLVTEEGRPIPISTGVHTISLAGPKREGKEYEFAVHEGDNVVIIALPVAVPMPTHNNK